MKKLMLISLSSALLFANSPYDANLSDINEATEIEGRVMINGKVVQNDKKVNLGDFIQTGENSTIKFNVGKDAFMVKANSKISIKEEKSGVKTLNVVTGGVVGVFKKGSKYNLKTHNMTAGVRGTGIYLESDNNSTYFCTCYGKTDVNSHSHDHKELHSVYHKMVVVDSNGTIRDTKEMRNHSDDELRVLEKKMNRKPRFDIIDEIGC